MKVKKTKCGFSLKAESKEDSEKLRILLSEMSKEKRKDEDLNKNEKCDSCSCK